MVVADPVVADRNRVEVVAIHQRRVVVVVGVAAMFPVTTKREIAGSSSVAKHTISANGTIRVAPARSSVARM